MFGKKLKGFMAKAQVTATDNGSKAVVTEATPEQVPVTAISNAEPAAANTTDVEAASKTNADQVLTSIMKELKIGELAFPEMKSDEVSEFDGKSAQVLEGDTSEESEEDQVARRVDAVVAAAEEIRKKKKNAEKSSKSISRKKEKETAEARDEDEEIVASRTEKQNEKEKPLSSNKSVKSKTLDEIEVSPEDDMRKEDSQSLSTFGTADETFEDEINNDSRTDTDDADTIDNNTSEEEETRTMRSSRKKNINIMNKDVIIHAPGGPENLVVRKMYYTPAAKEPEDVVIQVEVSKSTCFLC